MTTTHRDTRTPKALLVTMVILVISHSLTQDSANAWTRSLPFLLIMVLGELVREYVVARVPACDDAATRARRRRLAAWWVLGGMLLAGISVAQLLLGWTAKGSLWVYPLFTAWIASMNVAAGLVHADLMQKARAQPTHERTAPSPFVLIGMIVVGLAAIAAINEPLYESVRAGHGVGVAHAIRLVVSVLMFSAFVVVNWRLLNRSAAPEAVTSTEHDDG